MPQTVIESTTQQYLDIYDITDDVLILKDGSTAVVLTVNAMNFGLLAEPEQDAIMYAYAGMLNSLNYPIQIVIRSQTKDVTSYLSLLKEEEEKMTSDVKKRWISRYREFVADLIKERNVLDKKFYVVVSASSLEMGLLPPSSVIPGQSKVDLSTIERSVILEKAKEILEPRRDHLLGQLGRIGLYGYQLATQEIIQLFYLSYNPEAAEGQQITDTQSYTTPLVQASVQGGIMDSTTMPSANPTQVQPTPATPEPTPATAAPQPTAPTVETPTAPVMPAATAEPTTPMTPTAPIDSAAPTPNMPASPVAASSIPNISVPSTPVAPAASATPTPTPTPPATQAPTPTPAQPTTPPSSAAASTPATPSEPVSADVASIQNEINSTLQQLGGSAPAAPAVPDSTTPAAETKPLVGTAAPSSTTDQPAENMPPLPEI